MGQLHNEIRRGNLGPALKAALGADDADGTLERFSETIGPVIDLWSLPEWAALRDEVLGVILVSQGAVVGESSFIAVVNPTGSGMIVTVEAARVFGSIQTLALGQATALAFEGSGSISAGFVRDRRLGIGALFRSRTNAVFGTDAAQLMVTQEFVALASATEDKQAILSVPAVLSPGTGYGVQGQTNNLALVAGFRFRERAALPGELV